MKSIFDKDTKEEIIQRINSLSENSSAQWGKMNVHQMLRHCTIWEEMVLGKKKYKRAFIGRIFGKIALKTILKDESPLRKSTPTMRELVITEKPDFNSEKAKWMALIQEYEHFSNPEFEHAFFGKMTLEQIGQLVYKHNDHHLRQFNS